ncbi:MAG: MDR family MFS transporter [Thermoanaerobaculia bacterium]
MRSRRWDRVNPWRGLSGLPREVWVLFAATLVNKAGSMVLPFFVLYLTREAGLSVQTASLVVLLYGAGALVAAPVAGRLSDRLGPISIMRGSLLLSGLVLLAFPFARSLPAIVVATLALSVTAEAFRPANLTIMGDLVAPEKRKTAFALNRLAINLGMSVGPALGGLLATVSFRWLFLVDGATAVVAGVILAASRFPPHRRTAELRQLEEAVAPHLRLPAGAHRDPRLLYFLAAMFPVAFVFFQHISSMPLYMVRDLELSEAAYGILFTVNTLLIVFLEVGINSATAHWPHRRTLALGSALCGIGFGALAWATDIWQVAATVVVWTFGEMLIFPGMADYLTDIAPEARRGEYMGLSQMMMGLAFTVGPWAGLQVLAVFGGESLWLLMLALGLAAALMMSRLKGSGHRIAETDVPFPTTAPSTEP